MTVLSMGDKTQWTPRLVAQHASLVAGGRASLVAPCLSTARASGRACMRLAADAPASAPARRAGQHRNAIRLYSFSLFKSYINSCRILTVAAQVGTAQDPAAGAGAEVMAALPAGAEHAPLAGVAGGEGACALAAQAAADGGAADGGGGDCEAGEGGAAGEEGGAAGDGGRGLLEPEGGLPAGLFDDFDF